MGKFVASFKGIYTVRFLFSPVLARRQYFNAESVGLLKENSVT